jgi:hypothetical protein
MIKKRVLVASFCCCLSGVSFGMQAAPHHPPVAAHHPFTIHEDAVFLRSLGNPNYALEFLQWEYAEIADGKWFLRDLYPARTNRQVIERLTALENDEHLRQAAQERIARVGRRAASIGRIPRPVSPSVW